jgi:hypothetical protein
MLEQKGQSVLSRDNKQILKSCPFQMVVGAQSDLVHRKMMEETMAVKMGDKNHEITTGVKPLRYGNCREGQKVD